MGLESKECQRHILVQNGPANIFFFGHGGGFVVRVNAFCSKDSGSNLVDL